MQASNPRPPECHAQERGPTRTVELFRLQLRAYNQPDSWVCEVCIALHEATPDDTPHTHVMTPISCPLGRLEWGRRAYGCDAGCRVDPRTTFQLDHRHVQLALKYLRLRGPLHRAHYEELTRTPDRPQAYRASLSSAPDPTEPTALYRAEPKIVWVDDHRRFLVKSVWSFRPHPQEPLGPDTLRDVRVCPHLYRSGRGSWDVNRTPLNRAFCVATVAKRFGLEHTFGCEHCPTDYLIRIIHPVVVEIHAWQDFGPETWAADPAWRSHCRCALPESTTSGWAGDRLPAPSVGRVVEDGGRIRRWYEDLLGDLYFE
ncbi:hypothetical protein F5Y14DRAFT_405234 [Nemania sp. NC0429]|nr:hypothetical protein F5Y14DRAFT_405234 [Nemania sp. NC0429]